MKEIGRNDPCPCGSGKKFKHCCLGKAKENKDYNPAQQFMNEAMAIANERNFESLEELQAVLGGLTEKKNRVSNIDFLGFSSEQMHRMLHHPLESLEDIIKFKHDLNPGLYQDVPIVKNTCYFLSRLKELQPLKATQKGNLPLAFTRELHEKFHDSDLLYRRPVRSEEDILTVHTLRHVLKMCGWVKKVKNQYSLTRKGSDIVVKGFSGNNFFTLVNVFARRFNWAFQDRYPEFWIIQGSVAFSLYMVQQKAKNPISEDVLANAFIRAFPSVLDETEYAFRQEPEDAVRRCFSLRFLERFCEYFGLVDIHREKVSSFEYRRIIEKSAFYDQYIRWVK